MANKFNETKIEQQKCTVEHTKTHLDSSPSSPSIHNLRIHQSISRTFPLSALVNDLKNEVAERGRPLFGVITRPKGQGEEFGPSGKELRSGNACFFACDQVSSWTPPCTQNPLEGLYIPPTPRKSSRMWLYGATFLILFPPCPGQG